MAVLQFSELGRALQYNFRLVVYSPLRRWQRRTINAPLANRPSILMGAIVIRHSNLGLLDDNQRTIDAQTDVSSGPLKKSRRQKVRSLPLN